MLDSSAEYKKAIREDGRIMSVYDTYKFADGTELAMSTGNLKKYSINGATSDSSSFSIGATVIKAYTATLDNTEGKFDAVDFEGLNILARVGLLLPDGTTEIIQKGKYRCVSAKVRENVVDIKAYDSMLFFDRPYSKSTLAYPATILQILQDACTCCQMTLNEKTLQNSNLVVQKPPDDSTLTFRDVIGYCAQMMCRYAVIDNLDQLSFGWYDFTTLESLQKSYDGGSFSTASTPYSDGDVLDGGNFTDYSSGSAVDGGGFADQKLYHHLYSLGSQSINTDDICISGIAVKPMRDGNETEETYLYGTDGYVLLIEGNPLIQSASMAEIVASYIGEKMVGKKFRPLSITCRSDPCMEAGDCACVTDRKQRTFFTVITNTTFSFGTLQQVECTAETPTEKNYTKYSAATKLLDKAKKETQKELTSYDLSVQQLTNLMAQSFGVFKTEEKEADGSIIYYMHNKPELSSSSTIWKMTADAFAVSTDGGQTWNAGVDAEGNALVNILSAIGIKFDWAKGGTLTLGGEDNVDGVLTVHDASGNVVCKISKDGVETNSAKITGGTININTGNAADNIITLRRVFENGDSSYARLSPTWIRLQNIPAGGSSANGGSNLNLLSDTIRFVLYSNGIKYGCQLSPVSLKFYEDDTLIGGIESGVVIGNEHGSNSNGEYYKFHDGTLICTKMIPGTWGCANTWGSLYDTNAIELGDWAYGFSEKPTVSATFITDGSFAWLEGINGTSATAIGKTFLCRANSAQLYGSIHVTGIGRWK